MSWNAVHGIGDVAAVISGAFPTSRDGARSAIGSLVTWRPPFPSGISE